MLIWVRKLKFYFPENHKKPFISVFTISGIFETGFKEMDETYLLGDYTHIQRINNWEEDEVDLLKFI